MCDRGDPGPLYAAIERRRRSEPVVVLSEVKVQSPRDGNLLRDRDPEILAREMEAAGAGGISVVVEPDHFGGSLDLLETVAASVDIPVLAKDFFDSNAEIDRAVDHGADAVLLINSELDTETLGELFEHCLQSGVTPLVETHTPEEVTVANELRAPLVGINNRDIGRLERDDGGVERTATMAADIHDEAIVVSESSLSSPEEVRRAVDAGADAVLVGTAILTADDPGAAVERLRSI